MLAQAYRDVLIQATIEVLRNQPNFELFIDGVRPGTSASVIPRTPGATYKGAVTAVIDTADAQNWLRDLVQLLAAQNAARTEFTVVLAEIDRAAPLSTIANPFDEVLLEGDRPFVNRQPLRAHLLDLTAAAGSCVMTIDGESQTGKTYSYYLINHVGPKKGFIVNRFRLGRLPKPDQLAGEILGRVGVDKPLPPIGSESAERWADKLADIVARAIEERKAMRLFVFDEFSDTPLPEGTASLIVRLATYADEELRPYLRVVLMRFKAPLSPDIEDVVLRDVAQPFTATDMVAVVMQIAKARNWDVTEATVKQKVDGFLLSAERTLKERFNFLRELLRKLAKGPQ